MNDKTLRHQELADFFNDPTPMERPDDLPLMDEIEIHEELAAARTRVSQLSADIKAITEERDRLREMLIELQMVLAHGAAVKEEQP